MSAIADNITSLEDQILDALTAAQDPIVEALGQVVETVNGFLPEERPTVPFADQLPTLDELVELSYGFAEKLLQRQHELAKAVVDAVAPLYPEAKPAPSSKTVKAKVAAA